ncbi:triphosphoribosyl-dephospho-CoA synthase [Orbus hercynius]|uniref:Probable 2-(5''-triphosphoribosyl)-3'-dephosphocoenzyme-A synthase n=1 Tax=Orbus hercynius TaxID=593135 RepID=A0A495RKM3_9GAMM|nr:triphosphoribosyl-dephospho-CoA synthase CitG [Orbus hercynius]RKS87716.1 triphosphoribosyl-dephospho-CoA synthase [Orbus hercynius]
MTHNNLNTTSNVILQLRQSLALQQHQLHSSAAKLAQAALLTEVDLTPKPGLVDQANSGSHKDMDLLTFLRSIYAITPYFDQFYQYGIQTAHDDNQSFLTNIRPLGISCEKAMFLATNGVNTHKGAIFAFGLLLSSLGRLHALDKTINDQTICAQISTLCQGMVARELSDNQGQTMGERLYQQYGLTGARGEAESGYTLVTKIALPSYLASLQQGYSEAQCLLQAMLSLLAYNDDTNIVSRGGLDGLNLVKQHAQLLLEEGGALIAQANVKLQQFDQVLIEKNLSPGGTADLIAVTWFLSHYHQ